MLTLIVKGNGKLVEAEKEQKKKANSLYISPKIDRAIKQTNKKHKKCIKCDNSHHKN